MDSGTGIGGLSLGQDEVLSSVFDLFSSVEVENSVRIAHENIYHPVTQSSSRGPYKFEIPADPIKFTDIQTMRLMGAMRLRKKAQDNTFSDFQDNDVVSTVNTYFQSLWAAINIKLNGTDITDPTAKWYAYKAHIETLLSYSKTCKDTILGSRGFYADTADKFDDVGLNAASLNKGFKTRAGIFSESKWNYFCINIHSDLSTLRRVLPPNIKIEVECIRNDDAFTVMTKEADGSVAIELKELKLKVKRYTASQKIETFYSQKITRGLKPILPIDRSLIKTYTIQPGTNNLSHYNLITGGQLPDQVIIGMVTETAHTGHYQKNPFNFQHFNLKEASLVVNGVHEPENKYQLDINNRNVVTLYQDFLENIGISTDDREIGISGTEYYGGNFLLAFDRTKDKCNRFHRHSTDSGSIDINLRSSTNLTETITVIVYATYSSDLIIEEGNKVVTAIF